MRVMTIASVITAVSVMTNERNDINVCNHGSDFSECSEWND